VKLSSFSRECLALGFEEELLTIDMPGSPSESFILIQIRGKEISFTAKVLTAVGDHWTAAFERTWKDCLHVQEQVLQQRATVSCCRFWWEVSHEGHLEELKLKARDRRKGYVMNGSGGCGSNCAAESEPHITASLFRRTLSAAVKSVCEEMSAAQKFMVQHSSRINRAGYPNYSCPYQSPCKSRIYCLKT
jgi:hypothetical protein